jgi:hypothetical protein
VPEHGWRRFASLDDRAIRQHQFRFGGNVMSNQAVLDEEASPFRRFLAASKAAAGLRRFWLILPMLVFLLGVVAGLVKFWTFIQNSGDDYIPLLVPVVLTIVLSLLPAMICVVQSTTRRRQLNRLGDLDRFPVSRTTYFRTAIAAVDSMQAGTLTLDFGIPLFFYFVVIFIGFIVILTGLDFKTTFSIPNVILCGLHSPNASDLADYQVGTFSVIAIAFLASYVNSLGRLLDRVNNNDLYPITLYYYAARVVIAVSVALVFRHALDAFYKNSSSILLLVAFAIGFAPDQFILVMIRRAFQTVKIWGARGDPKSGNRPRALQLLMVDDLSRDKIDRLSELGIDNAQVLARQNPFLLLPRVPFDLGLLVDWIGQAQLYVLVRDEKLAALRALFVRDVFDLRIRLASDETRAVICAAINLAETDGVALERQLDQDPSFVRLKQVRDALITPA